MGQRGGILCISFVFAKITVDCELASMALWQGGSESTDGSDGSDTVYAQARLLVHSIVALF
jgi:hypothetical protein